MTKRVEIKIGGDGRPGQAALRGVRAELLGVDRDAGRASSSMSELFTRANPGAQTLTGLRAVRTALLGIAAAGAAATAAAAGVVLPAADREKSTAQFTALLKSAETAKRLLADLERTAAATPLQMGSIETVTKRLLVARVPIEQMTAKIQQLGDAAGGEADKLDRLSTAYAKVAAKGKASMQELNVFLEAGVPMVGALAEQFGIAEKDVFAFSSAGRIGFRDFDASLERLTTGSGLMAGQMAAMAETAAGKWSTLKDNLTLGAAQIGQGMLPPIKVAIDDILAEIQRLRESGKLEEWGQSAAVAVERLYAVLKGTASLLANHGAFIGMAGGGLIGANIATGLAARVMQIRANMAILQANPPGGRHGAGLATAAATLASLKAQTRGVASLAVEAKAAVPLMTRLGAAGKVVFGGAMVVGIAAVVAKMWELRGATDDVRRALKQLPDATGEYTDTGYFKALIDGARNAKNYWQSVFTGRPMAIAGEGEMIAAGAAPRPDKTKDQRTRGEKAMAAWSEPNQAVAEEFDLDPTRTSEAMAEAMRLVRERTKARRDQARIDAALGRDTEDRTVAGRMFGSGDEGADLRRLAAEALREGQGDAELGLRIVEERYAEQARAIHEGSKAVVAAAEDATKAELAARKAGMDAAEQLARLEIQEIRERARNYADEIRDEAAKRARAHADADRKERAEADRRRRRAADRWDAILRKPSAEERRQQRKDERQQRRDERTKRTLVDRAIEKIDRGREEDLTTREQRALLARRDEILAERAERKARVHGRGAVAAERAGEAANAQGRNLDRAERQAAKDAERRGLEAAAGGNRQPAAADPAVAEAIRALKSIEDILRQDRRD